MWYVGQKVVAIVDCPHEAFKKGDVFTVLNVGVPCNCNVVSLDVGIRSSSGLSYCTDCGYEVDSPILWRDADMFRPLDELSDYKPEELIAELEAKEPVHISEIIKQLS